MSDSRDEIIERIDDIDRLISTLRTQIDNIAKREGRTVEIGGSYRNDELTKIKDRLFATSTSLTEMTADLQRLLIQDS